MGFASGKSAAKRDAKKAESAEYDKFFAEAINGTRPKEVKLETNTDRYNATVKEYNSRVDEIARQYKGESITDKIGTITSELKTKQAATAAAAPKPVQQGLSGFANAGKGTISSPANPQAQGLGGFANKGKGVVSPANPQATGLGNLYNNQARNDAGEITKATAKFGALNGGYRGIGNQKAAFDDLQEINGRLNKAAKDDGVEEQIGVENSIGHQNVKASRKKARSATLGRGGTILTGGQNKARPGGATPVLGGR